MSQLRLVALVFVALLGAIGCAPSKLQMPPTTPASLQEPAGSREIATLLDLDVVNDIAAGGGFVYAATERGVLAFDGEGNTARIQGDRAFSAVAVDPAGVAIAASSDGLVAIRGVEVASDVSLSAIGGKVNDLHVAEDGTRWACGDRGVLREDDGAWMRIGDAAECMTFFPAAQGGLWVALDRGALFIEAEGVVREHREGRGLPAGFVRSLVPVGAEGEAYALVQSPSEAFLAHFDGGRWFTYTIDGFERKAVGLARRGSDVVLYSPDYAFVVRSPERGAGVRLTPLQRGDRDQVLAYRAEPVPATEIEVQEREPRRPVELASVPPSQPTVEAPPLVVEAAEATLGEAYLVRTTGGKTYVALRNQGVLVADDGERTIYSSRNLVARRDLQVASDERGLAWVVTDDGSIGVWQDEALRTVAGPEGARPWSIAAGPQGVYLASTVPAQPNAVQVHRRMPGDRWELVVERTLFRGAAPAEGSDASEGEPAPDAGEGADTETDTAETEAAQAAPAGPQLVGVPMMGVTDAEEIWLAVRVAADNDSGSRLRGVAVISPSAHGVVYHHERSDPAVDGEGSLRMPDDFEAMDLNDPGMAWFATLVGAIRIGNFQSVYFGEDRGVRGEVVSDVLVGERGRLWVAAAEGPGYRSGDTFEFRMPGFVKEARPLRLAMDSEGRIWAAGPNGLLVSSDDEWTAFGEDQGLPTTELVDVEADANGNLWLLTGSSLLRLSRPTAAQAE